MQKSSQHSTITIQSTQEKQNILEIFVVTNIVTLQGTYIAQILPEYSRTYRCHARDHTRDHARGHTFMDYSSKDSLVYMYLWAFVYANKFCAKPFTSFRVTLLTNGQTKEQTTSVADCIYIKMYNYFTPNS